MSQIPAIQIEPLATISSVEQYRNYWKPDRVRVILLAESYVYTSAVDFSSRLKTSEFQRAGLDNYPDNYVRFVYCLGYGEDGLLTRPVNKNTGTPQFWKIFYSCLFRIQKNEDCAPVMKKGTGFGVRLSNKIHLLQKLKDNGIWLLDASVMALYGRDKGLSSSKQDKVISTCWNSYIKNLIVEAKPLKLICIGQGVAKTLENRLALLSRETGVEIHFISQPQAHLPAQEHIRNYQRYYEICKESMASGSLGMRKAIYGLGSISPEQGGKHKLPNHPKHDDDCDFVPAVPLVHLPIQKGLGQHSNREQPPLTNQ